MSKLRIEHGTSRTKRTKLQTYIDQTIADDSAAMAEYTNNEQHYIVNELLRFALAQSEDYQKYKADLEKSPSRTTMGANPMPVASRAATDPPAKSVAPATSPTKHP